MLTLREILILGLFLGISTLKRNISRTAWPITVIHISFFAFLKLFHMRATCILLASIHAEYFIFVEDVENVLKLKPKKTKFTSSIRNHFHYVILTLISLFTRHTWKSKVMDDAMCSIFLRVGVHNSRVMYNLAL